MWSNQLYHTRLTTLQSIFAATLDSLEKIDSQPVED